MIHVAITVIDTRRPNALPISSRRRVRAVNTHSPEEVAHPEHRY